ncbi:hypothetical protein BSZ37_10350 [Rubrivirga marina]|uniref:Calx-beta domain-containing protein n=1 Tax=Rubrivirga marina TaxID=1196024 RepID=A0A271J188_9BACT|nr:hypothetical protein BSZ37_10350 [Rubrivirga marina]
MLALLAVPAALAQNPTVTLGASPTSISEAGGQSTLRATLSATTDEVTTVTIAVAGDSDAYSLGSSTITIPANQTTGTTTLTGTSDNDFEDETISIFITNVVGDDGDTSDDPDEDGDQQVDVTIEDDDIPTVRLLVNSNTLTEGESTIVRARLPGSATADGDITVTLGYSGGAGEFVSPTTLVIPDGQTSGTVTFEAIDDTDFESPVTVTISIDAVAGNATEEGTQTQTITINDNDASPPTVTLTSNRNQVSENGGTATLTVRISELVSTATVVTLSTEGDADAFELADTQLTIPAGQRTATTTFTGTQDDDFDDDEVQVDISNVSGGGGAIESGSQLLQITVTDDDTPAVTLALGAASITEGDSTTVTVSLPSGTLANGPVRVQLGYAYDDGDEDPSDNPNEVTGPAQITIPNGANSAFAYIVAVDDTDDEVQGELTVSITGVTGNGIEDEEQGEETLAILDNDDLPEVTFDADPNVIAESNGVSRLVMTLSNASDRRVGVVLSYIGSASRGSDYTAPDTVFVQPGQLTGVGQLRSVGGDDKNEQIYVEVAEVINGVEAGGNGGQQEFITLNPDLNQVTASFAVAELEASEGDGSIQIRVNLAPAAEANSSVRVTLDADASTGSAADLGGTTSQTATFATGETTATVSFPIADDAILEGDETFVFTLTNGSNVVPDGSTLTLTLEDNDTDTELLISEFDGIVAGADPEFVELVAAGAGALADGLSLVFYDSDSTAVVVNDLDGLVTDDNGFLVVTGDDEGIAIPDDFLGVAVFRGNGPTLGSTFDPENDAVVDAVFIDEQAAADEQGQLARDGSLQLQDRGGFAFVVPPTPGEENEFGAGVSIDPEGPISEALVGDVFPNPSAGRAAVEFAVEAGQHVTVEVFDALGRSVLTAFDGDARPGTAVRVELTGRALTPGVYVVRVAGESFAETRQLTVTR